MANVTRNLMFHSWSMRMCLSVTQQMRSHGHKALTSQTATLPPRSVSASHFGTSAPIWAEKLEADDLVITDACVEQLKKIGKDGEFLRVVVEGGGCSGFTYKFQLDSELEEDDKIFARDGVKVVTDELSLDLIKGSQVDYAQELIRSAFRLSDNPQSKNSCSCGVSFSID